MQTKNEKSQKSSILQNIISIPSCCFLGLIFSLMDCVSYGRALLPSNEHKSNENISMFIFLMSSMTSQIIYGLVTQIKSGIIAETIVENFIYYNKIYRVCESNCKSLPEIICNTLICVCLGTLLFSFITFLLMKFNLARILKIIPKSAVTGCLGAIGISQFEVGLGELSFDRHNLTRLVFVFLIITTVLAFAAFALQELFPDLFFIIPLYSLIVILGFFAIARFIYGRSIVDLIKLGWLSEINNAVLLPNLILDNLKLNFVNLQAIKENISNIFSLALFSLIHLPINLPVYSIETKLQTDFQKELRTQAVANFFTAFCFSPTYFVCSNSIFFRRSGATKKMHSIILGASILSLFYFGTTIRSYIPCICLAMFPFFFGFSICYSAFYNTFYQCERIDYLILLITTGVCYYQSMENGILIGTFLNSVWFINRYIKSINEQKSRAKLREHNVLVVNYILCFATLNKFENNLKRNINTTIFDLRGCYAVDWLARDYFYDVLGEMKDLKVEIVGLPYGLDKFKLQGLGASVFDNEGDYFSSKI